mmetsp:Transcript_29672/g.30806  ORF Transcript_29672/g.30806 Transcript_29672/m.30806 type:complete len:272 (+) Transcript_29672:10-825(+)
MPLLVLVGGPCSGKTTQANKLKDYLVKEKNQEVIIVNEESLELNKLDYYKDFNTEKNLRAKLKSEVEKHLDDKKIVIIDYLNYIKGFRYELYCLVRNYKTRLCMVYLKIEYEICFKYNEEKKYYPEDLLKDLYSRMEEPQAKNRWDSPLHQVYFEEELPYEEIFTQLVDGKRPSYAVSTHTEKKFDSDFLQELEAICSNINSNIIEQQANGLVESVKIDDYFIYLKKVFSGVELKKLKQEFTKICKMHPPKNKVSTMKSYVEYINTVQERY